MPTFDVSRISLSALAISAVLTLVSCAEKEKILPGPREDIHSEPRAEDEPIPAAEFQEDLNESRAIRLPSATTNKDWTQGFGTPKFRVAHPALRAGAQRIWSVDIGAGNSRKQRITADPVVAGGRVFVMDADAQVSAISPQGAVLWRASLIPARDKSGDATGGGLAYAEGTLFATTGYGQLVALDPASGGVRWRQELDATGSGAPTVYDGMVYLIAGDETAWVIDAKTGRTEWQVTSVPSIAHVLGAPAPAITDKLAIFAFGSGDMVATFRKGGLRRWEASVSGKRVGRALSRFGDMTGAPVVVGDTLYAGNHSGRIAAFNAESGARIWTAKEGAISPVWPAGDSIFAVTESNQLTRLDASDGSTIWSVPLPRYLKDKPGKRGPIHASFGPVLAGGRVVVPGADGYVRYFDPKNGALINQVEIPGGAAGNPVVAGGTLYVTGTKGQLHAFR